VGRRTARAAVAASLFTVLDVSFRSQKWCIPPTRGCEIRHPAPCVREPTAARRPRSRCVRWNSTEPARASALASAAYPATVPDVDCAFPPSVSIRPGNPSNMCSTGSTGRAPRLLARAAGEPNVAVFIPLTLSDAHHRGLSAECAISDYETVSFARYKGGELRRRGFPYGSGDGSPLHVSDASTEDMACAAAAVNIRQASAQDGKAPAPAPGRLTAVPGAGVRQGGSRAAAGSRDARREGRRGRRPRWPGAPPGACGTGRSRPSRRPPRRPPRTAAPWR
jgi:hypothetical protein